MRRAALFGALALIWACAATAQEDGAVCRFARSDAAGGDQGLGGTGLGSDVLSRLVGIDDDRGIGGTGVIAQDRGLGGTGVEGTGLIGVVTGFASICLNGYEIEVDDGSIVTVEGLPATAEDIRLGQVVEVEAFPVNGKLTAATVKVRVAVAGPVQAMAADRSSLTVAGQQVQIAGFGGSAEVPGLGIGAWVAVSGLRRDDDVVVGTSVVGLPGPGREVLVAGTARAADGGGVRLGGLALTAAQVAAGDSVVVRGTLAGDALAARASAVETGAAFSPRVRDVVVQAYLNTLDAAQARVGGLTVDLSRAAIEANVRAALAARAVQAVGRVQAGGTVAVERVTVTPVPIDRARAIQLPERSQQTPPTDTPAIERERGAATPGAAVTPERAQRAIEQRRERVREELRRRERDGVPAERPTRPVRPETTRPERPIDRPIDRPVRPDPVRPERPVRPGT
ncbi:MAG: DUF5666 domain-containing protein [Rhodospirillaceae bacterium]|nr:DUF5666 domain-containing protein [Rhodospirillaceae bacterium]